MPCILNFVLSTGEPCAFYRGKRLLDMHHRAKADQEYLLTSCIQPLNFEGYASLSGPGFASICVPDAPAEPALTRFFAHRLEVGPASYRVAWSFLMEWRGDLVAVKVAELAAVLDAFSRQIVGWMMSDHLTDESR